jgi:sarcosine oxidase
MVVYNKRRIYEGSAEGAMNVNTAVEVLVVGLGAMGSAATYQLAKRGVKVIGIEGQKHSPHEAGSSHGDTRITREFTGEGLEYVPLVKRSHEIWRELEAEKGELLRQLGGLLLKCENGNARRHGGDDFVRDTVEVAKALGTELPRLDIAGLRRDYPQFIVPDDAVGYFDPTAGFVRPERCITAQLAAAKKYGASLRFGEKVHNISKDGEGVLITTGASRYRAQHVILAAGAWLPRLLDSNAWLSGPEEQRLDRRLQVLPQAQFWFTALDPDLWSEERCPIFIWFHGDNASDFFYGFPLVKDGVGGVKVATEQYKTIAEPDVLVRDVSSDDEEAMFRRHVAPHLRGVTLPCVKASACFYTFNQQPKGKFIIGAHPTAKNVTLLSPCSGHGFKHSAAIGEAVAQAIIGESPRSDVSLFAL